MAAASRKSNFIEDAVMKSRLVLLLAAVLAGAASGPGQAALVVLNKSDHEAALVDPDAYTVLAKLPTGKGPHEVAVSPDGRYAYVSNYGSFGVFRPGEQPKQEPGRTITVLDLKGREVKATFGLGSFTQPHGIWVSRDGRRLWVTCEGAKAVLELDAETGKALKVWKTDQQTSHMVVPMQDEKKLYVTNIGSGSVIVDEAATEKVANIPTGAGAEGIAVSPDGKEVWVSNRAANTISVISTARSEEHTSELQSPLNLVCRLLL